MEFKSQSYTVRELAIEISGDPEGKPLDGLLEMTERIRDFAESHNVSLEDAEQAMWAVEPWPDGTCSEHLVVRVKVAEAGPTRHIIRS